MFQGDRTIGSQSCAVEQSPVGACQIFNYDDVAPLEDAGMLARYAVFQRQVSAQIDIGVDTFSGIDTAQADWLVQADFHFTWPGAVSLAAIF